MDFVFLGKGINANDISSADHFAGLPVVGIEPLVLMKLGPGRTQDPADIVQLLNLGKVPVPEITKRLTDKDERDDFKHVVEMAKAEKRGETKKARRIFFTLRR